MIPMSTQALLVAWGRWGAGSNLGYPNGSSEFVERALKTPLYPSNYAPPDVLEIDRAICIIEPEFRTLLIQKYQWKTYWKEAVKLLGYSKSRYYNRLEEAHWAVHIALGQ